MISRSVPHQQQNFRVTIEQALLGDELRNCHPKTPRRWWEHLRSAACWILWQAKNDISLGELDTSHLALLQKPCHKLKLYIQDSWDGFLRTVKATR
jgi:hypothetical protein